ncbi:unnamed protein product, partial [Ectocarpus sp. 12 AP-2014]
HHLSSLTHTHPHSTQREIRHHRQGLHAQAAPPTTIIGADEPTRASRAPVGTRTCPAHPLSACGGIVLRALSHLQRRGSISTRLRPRMDRDFHR